MAEYIPKYNNFECWFPEGSYRLKGKNLSLIQHLDRVLRESGFNHKYFQHLMKRRRPIWKEVGGLASIVREGKALNSEQETRLRELDIELTTIYMDTDALLEPIYYKMRELGFSHEELIR